MPKYLLLKHYRGGPDPLRPVPPMDQWAPEDVEAHFRYDNVDDYIRVARDTGGQFARAWDGASDEQRAAMTAELEERFQQFRVEDGYAMTGVAACVLAS